MGTRSLRSRMTIAFALAFAVLIAVFGGFIIWFARHMAQRNADATLDAAVSKIRGEYSESAREHDRFAWGDEPGEWTQKNLALVLVDAQGHAISKTPGSVPTWPHPDRENWRIRIFALDNRTVVVGYRWQRIESTLRTEAALLMALCTALLLGATVGTWLLVGRTLSPIYELSLQADAASLESLRVHLDAPSPDAEIVHLVGTLNAMLERLADAISARERFYAAASHELRTPLQTLRGFLELALMRERTAADYRTALAEAHAQSERLTSLVQALLLLNQLEAMPPSDKQIVDLSAVCRARMEEFVPTAEARNLRFSGWPTNAVLIEVSPSHLDIFLRNLLENAVKYAEAGSEISVCLRSLPTEAFLTIFNRCAEVPDWDDEKLFEPFYRPDVSRNSDTGGNGLGLAICRAIANANVWLLSLQRAPLGVEAKVIFTSRLVPAVE